jgi:hypothetical protein
MTCARHCSDVKNVNMQKYLPVNIQFFLCQKLVTTLRTVASSKFWSSRSFCGVIENAPFGDKSVVNVITYHHVVDISCHFCSHSFDTLLT